MSRNLVFDYTNPEYSESSMHPETLIKFADYLGEEKYYFCNEYHIFLEQEDAGSLLRKLKKEHKMTRQQFAFYLGISYERVTDPMRVGEIKFRESSLTDCKKRWNRMDNLTVKVDKSGAVQGIAPTTRSHLK